jgi:hypothetical protein
MNWSILLGILGILASVAVGLGTFLIADKRTRKNRYQNAKDLILRELSKSLGEDNIPNHLIISATIRSVLRENNSDNLEAVSVSEILDDLIRQITSDPFLDSERRKKLQTEITTIKKETITEKEPQKLDQITTEKIIKKTAWAWTSFISAIIGILASIITAFGFFSIKFESLLDFLKTNSSQGFEIIIAILGSIISVLITLFYKWRKDVKRQ